MALRINPEGVITTLENWYMQLHLEIGASVYLPHKTKKYNLQVNRFQLWYSNSDDRRNPLIRRERRSLCHTLGSLYVEELFTDLLDVLRALLGGLRELAALLLDRGCPAIRTLGIHTLACGRARKVWSVSIPGAVCVLLGCHHNSISEALLLQCFPTKMIDHFDVFHFFSDPRDHFSGWSFWSKQNMISSS